MSNLLDYSTPEGTEVPNLIRISRDLPRYFASRFIPVFVFDGVPITLEQELTERRTRRQEAVAQADTARERRKIREVAQYQARAQRITPIRRTTKALLELLDLPFF